MIEEKIIIKSKEGALIEDKGSIGYRPYLMIGSFSRDDGNPITTINYGRGRGVRT